MGYIPEASDSESGCSSSDGEMEISDAESDAIVDETKDDVKQVSGQKRKCHPSEDDGQDSDNEAEMESDDELYNAFRSKLVVSDPSKVEELGGSDDEEFVPTESQDSQDESQDEGSQDSDKSNEEMDVSDDEINDLELSSEEEIYFMNSQYTSSLKDTLDSGKIENGGEVDRSFILKNGSESSGIAVNMKGQNWRSAHAFEDSTSGKCFALVISTDTWEHLSNNYEHLEAHYPDQKWSSVSETELKFQMNDFVC